MTVWTRSLLLRVTPELVADVKTDQEEMASGSSLAKEQFWRKSVNVIFLCQMGSKRAGDTMVIAGHDHLKTH